MRGSKADPQPGDQVTVTVELSTDSDQTRDYTYTFDGTQTRAQFVAMVKGEIAAHIAQLNADASAADATEDFRP